MNTAVIGHLDAPRLPKAEAHAGLAECRSAESKVAAMRAALVAGLVVAAVVTWLATSGVGQAAEPELAMLLRGMAAIKGMLAICAAGLVWWRLGQAVSARAAVAYIACTWALFAATVLIWQLAFILAAAILFHAAALVGLVVAMREGRETLRFGRQAPNPSIERLA